MYSHVPPRLLGAVLSIVICVAARAAISFVMTANALRMVRLAGGAEHGVGFEMSYGMAGLAPCGTGEAQDWRAIRAQIMRRLRKWRLSLPDGKAAGAPGRSAGVIAALSFLVLVFRHGPWPRTMGGRDGVGPIRCWPETVLAREDAGSSRAEVRPGRRSASCCGQAQTKDRSLCRRRGSACEFLVLDPLGFQCVRAETAFLVFLVILEIAFEPLHMGLAFECEDMGAD